MHASVEEPPPPPPPSPEPPPPQPPPPQSPSPPLPPPPPPNFGDFWQGSNLVLHFDRPRHQQARLSASLHHDFPRSVAYGSFPKYIGERLEED
ncbi:hypothetical protein Pmani_017915 [Petrolisthes manimaculis]|uniref:Uncharacterized protein n=1 Tax=Petrolisthes manimaculis TaxID=1843537 RepID=A0AAE1PLG9_9EUCA|nr:hypothetical protein Pmani_017915 [Petrolisthes manimaculis]